MARRKARKSRKMKTVEKEFIFDLTPEEGSISQGYAYLDVAQIHSLVNRVSARQGMNYAIGSIEIGCVPGGSFDATIYRFPEHWPCINAWEKTMRLWLKQQNEAAEEAGLESTKAAYRDFKIFFDADHQDAGFGANLLPAGYVRDDPASTADAYEWIQSEIVIPNDGAAGVTTERSLHMLGPDDGFSVGMIQAYAESRSRPQVTDPNIVGAPTGGIFGEMFDVGMDNEEVIDNMQDRNNEPPYLIYRNVDQEAYPGGSYQGAQPWVNGSSYIGQFVDTLSINANNLYNTDQTGPFAAPCGLIKIAYRGQNVPAQAAPVLPYLPPSSFWLKLTLVPGSYKGLMALPMKDVN